MAPTGMDVDLVEAAGKQLKEQGQQIRSLVGGSTRT